MKDQNNHLTWAVWIAAVSNICANRGLEKPKVDDFWFDLYNDGYEPLDAVDEAETYLT